jgi:hypothetical protein
VRELTDVARLHELLRALGHTGARGRVDLTGGASAVLFGWRASTVDVDLSFEPEHGVLFQALPELKERLHVNIELARPSDFVPELPGWRDRCLFIAREGELDAFHYDPYSQSLFKIERGHETDLVDVREMVRRGLVEPARLRELFAQVEADLVRHPAIDPPDLRRHLDAAF